MSANYELMPIRTIAELTGINSITLRAWERRYGLLKPLRTPSGHRLYSNEDLRRIEKILSFLAKGIAIGQVPKLLQFPDQVDVHGVDIWQEYRNNMNRYSAQFNIKAMDSIYNDALSLYPLEIVADNLLLPLLAELSHQQHAGSLAKLHFLKLYLRNKLGIRLHHANLISDGPTLVCACFGNEDYELQLLLFALYLIAHGYQVIYLGAQLPFSEICYTTSVINPAAILLAGTLKNAIIVDLENLRVAVSKPLLLLGSNHVASSISALGVICLAQNCYQAVKQVRDIVSNPKLKRKQHA